MPPQTEADYHNPPRRMTRSIQEDLIHGFRADGTWYSRTHMGWTYRTQPNGIEIGSWKNLLDGKTNNEVMEFWDKRKAAREKRERARAARGGWRLAAYHWEHEVAYPEFRKVMVTRERAAALLKRFARHFKTTAPLLEVFNRRGGGGHYHMSYGTGYIKLCKNPSLGLVCHEYAHHLARVRYGKCQGHNKKFKHELKRVYTFAKRYLPPVI